MDDSENPDQFSTDFNSLETSKQLTFHYSIQQTFFCTPNCTQTVLIDLNLGDPFSARLFNIAARDNNLTLK